MKVAAMVVGGIALGFMGICACAINEPSSEASSPMQLTAEAGAPVSSDDGREGGTPSGREAGVGTGTGSTPTPKPDTKCKGMFERDVLPGLAAGGCATAFCHGAPVFAPAGLRIDAKDGAVTYAELTGFSLRGKPYVKPKATDPKDSAIFCHLKGECGTKMPPGAAPAVDPEIVAAVGDWLACGAPRD